MRLELLTFIRQGLGYLSGGGYHTLGTLNPAAPFPVSQGPKNLKLFPRSSSNQRVG